MTELVQMSVRGVPLGTAELEGAFLFSDTPMPVATELDLGTIEGPRRARVTRAIETGGEAKAGMQLEWLPQAGATLAPALADSDVSAATENRDDDADDESLDGPPTGATAAAGTKKKRKRRK